MKSPILLTSAVASRVLFSSGKTPLIAKLHRAAFHRYQKRWNKRFLKKPIRWIFDAAYHWLKLGGPQTIYLNGPGDPVALTFDAQRVHIGGIVFPEYGDGYEPELGALLEVLLRDGRVFFDIGANWGYFTHYAASIDGYTGPIHAFEPVPATYADLENLVAQAGYGDRVQCHQVALSDRSEDGAMTAVDPLTCGWAKVDDTGSVPIRLSRLDDLDIPAPDVIKMDVEEHELAVIKGGVGVLSKHKPHILFESWLARENPELTIDPLRSLENMGYYLFLPNWQFGEGDHVFFSRDIHPRGERTPRRLALVQFSIEQRFFLPEQLNIFAVHHDRLGEVAADLEAAEAG